MLVFRRRLLYWLLKAYIKRWGKVALYSFLVGLFIFFIVISFGRYFFPKIPIGKHESIGMVGAYTLDSLPVNILQEVSSGLTMLSPDGKLLPSVARQWKVDSNGKKYTFLLKNNVYFSDNTKVVSKYINYNFSDAKVERPNDHTIVFNLRDTYSPFLTTVSRPIFKKGFVGTGPFVVKSVKLNGNFVESLTLVLRSDPYKTKTYQFYPTTTSLKDGYVLGAVSKAIGLPDILYKGASLASFPNTRSTKRVDYERLVTIFYNTRNEVLSDKRVRSALTYALPDSFREGQRAYLPFFPHSWAYDESYTYNQDIDRAKLLFSNTETGTKSGELTIEIKTLPQYKDTADAVATEWKKIGVIGKIIVVESIPSTFQVFLGSFVVPRDPDQYSLWHSQQENNITRYENKRIDKLLEDGRKTVDMGERKKIYSDFQKYLLADSPASFLYFPYEYEITRK